MRKSKSRETGSGWSSNVLKLHKTGGPALGTVRRHFLLWLKERGGSEVCDTPTCQFHTGPLVWNDRPLRLHLDHRDGASRNHNPKNLRFLCPNCHSQTVTYGGGNRGLVEYASETSYRTKDRRTRRNNTVIQPPTGTATLNGLRADISCDEGQEK